MSMAIRILRFVFTIAAAIFGIVGIVSVTGLTIAHLIRLESLGQPYFSPFSPKIIEDLKDSILRLPLKFMKKRPKTARPQDDIRGENF